VTKEAEIISEKNESWTENCETRQQQHESNQLNQHIISKILTRKKNV